MRKFLLSAILLLAVCLTGCVHLLPEEDAPGILTSATTEKNSGESTSGALTQESEHTTGEETSQSSAVTDDGYTKRY